MSRLIKFRAFWKGNIYRVIRIDWTEPHTIDLTDEVTDFRNILINEVELMQFTGFYDKIGKEIYEGDVVRAFRNKRTNIDGTVQRDFYEKAVVIWNNTLQGFQLNPLDNWVYTSWNELEVIGNVYENPELLGEG